MTLVLLSLALFFNELQASNINQYQSCYNIKTLKTFGDDLKHLCNNFQKNSYYACNTSETRTLPKDLKLKNLKAKSQSNVLDLLDSVDMTLFGYTCVDSKKKTKNKVTYKRYSCFNTTKHTCSNYTCYFTNNPYILFRSFPACSECPRLESTIEKSILVLVLGILCLLGNGVVIFRQVISFRKQLYKIKEIQIYNILVLSLSLADLLMAVYLIAISFEIRQKSQIPSIYFSEHRLCNALGVINFVSSQVSLTTIVLISFFRMYGAVRPYKMVRRRIAISLVVVSWIIWGVAGVLPVIDVEPFHSFFNVGIRDSQAHFSESGMFFAEYFGLFLNIQKQSSNDTSLFHIFDAINNYPSNSVLEKAMRKFKLIETLPQRHWSPVGYYNSQYFCFTNLMVDNFYSKSNFFTFLIIICNLVLCAFVIVAYLFIYLSMTQCRSRLFCFSSKIDSATSSENSIKQTKQRNVENQKILCTITLIVVTNVVFWIVMCLISLIKWEKGDLRNQEVLSKYLALYVKYQSVLFYLIPVNSILNPYIYFNRFWYSKFKKVKVQLGLYCCSLNQSLNLEASSFKMSSSSRKSLSTG